MNGYEKIENALKLDQLNYCSDLIVTIKCGDNIITELLLLEYAPDVWSWLYDWWEGEQEVELIGAQYVGRVYVETNNLEYIKEG